MTDRELLERLCTLSAHIAEAFALEANGYGTDDHTLCDDVPYLACLTKQYVRRLEERSLAEATTLQAQREFSDVPF